MCVYQLGQTAQLAQLLWQAHQLIELERQATKVLQLGHPGWYGGQLVVTGSAAGEKTQCEGTTKGNSGDSLTI